MGERHVLLPQIRQSPVFRFPANKFVFFGCFRRFSVNRSARFPSDGFRCHARANHGLGKREAKTWAAKRQQIR